MKWIKWLTGVFILVLIIIVIIANLGLGPIYFPFIYYFPGVDKVGHFFLMGFFSLLTNLLFRATKIKLISVEILKGSLLVFIVVLAEELSQLFLVYRGFSYIDLLFDIAGIWLFGRLASWWVTNNQNLT